MLPHTLPERLYDESYGLNCEPDDAFWWITGPGAIVEMKFSMGFEF
jgi:hypothetical protein